MIVHFHPRKLSEKPNSLTHQVDYYLKRGDRDFMLVNPQNLQPIFTQEKLAMAFHTTHLMEISLNAAALMDESIPILDTAVLFNDIRTGLQVDLIVSKELALCLKGSPSPCFSLSSSSLLLMDCHIYVPEFQPRPNHSNLHTHILQSKHNHPTAGHFGYNKTLELLCQDYVWPTIHADCKQFITQCILCTCNKPSCHCPYGLLQPLPIPECPWHSISMDFIEQLPVSKGYTTILVVIDCLSKEGVFIPTTDTVTSVNVADTFVTHVFSKHGIPLHVSSNHGSEFTSHFFCSLGSLLRMHPHFTSSHHPSANSQVEQVNSTLEQYLWIYCNYEQDNWSTLLLLAEFTYNNTPHATTGVSPFFVTCGYDPLIAVYPDAKVTDLCAKHFAMNFNKVHKFLCD